MRYFLLIFVVCVAAVIGIAGKRGTLSRKTPLYIFPDMRRQLKLRPQSPNDFFENGVSSQLPPAGTIARSQPVQTLNGAVYPFEDAPVNTGRITGTTNFVALNPLPVTGPLLQRGRDRFTIYCATCHGALADGNGITKRLGVMPAVANLQDKRIVGMADGEIFNTITFGKGLMGAHGPMLSVEYRWAVVAYLRALELSQLGSVEELPPDQQAELKK